jgi:hypothetical protein
MNCSDEGVPWKFAELTFRHISSTPSTRLRTPQRLRSPSSSRVHISWPTMMLKPQPRSLFTKCLHITIDRRRGFIIEMIFKQVALLLATRYNTFTGLLLGTISLARHCSDKVCTNVCPMRLNYFVELFQIYLDFALLISTHDVILKRKKKKKKKK